jgi:hypothetical protein
MLFGIKCWVPRNLEIWLFSQYDLGLAVQVPTDPEDSTVIHFTLQFI